MLALAVLIAMFLGLSGLFVVVVRRLSEAELSFWSAFGILVIAKAASRALPPLLPDTDSMPRFGVTLAIYVSVLTGGLMITAKLRPIVALAIALCFSLLVLITTFVIALSGLLDAATRR